MIEYQQFMLRLPSDLGADLTKEAMRLCLETVPHHSLVNITTIGCAAMIMDSIQTPVEKSNLLSPDPDDVLVHAWEAMQAVEAAINAASEIYPTDHNVYQQIDQDCYRPLERLILKTPAVGPRGLAVKTMMVRDDGVWTVLLQSLHTDAQHFLQEGRS